jgi:hypothetical protein
MYISAGEIEPAEVIKFVLHVVAIYRTFLRVYHVPAPSLESRAFLPILTTADDYLIEYAGSSVNDNEVSILTQLSYHCFHVNHFFVVPTAKTN